MGGFFGLDRWCLAGRGLASLLSSATALPRKGAAGWLPWRVGGETSCHFPGQTSSGAGRLAFQTAAAYPLYSPLPHPTFMFLKEMDVSTSMWFEVRSHVPRSHRGEWGWGDRMESGNLGTRERKQSIKK